MTKRKTFIIEDYDNLINQIDEYLLDLCHNDTTTINGRFMVKLFRVRQRIFEQTKKQRIKFKSLLDRIEKLIDILSDGDVTVSTRRKSRSFEDFCETFGIKTTSMQTNQTPSTVRRPQNVNR
jgi:hypothetical protein